MARTASGSGYLSILSGLGFAANDHRTIVGWFYNNSATPGTYFSLGLHGQTVNRQFASGQSGTAMLSRSQLSAGTYEDVTGVTPGTGVWFHIVAKYASASLRSLHINGSLQGTGTATVTLNTAPDTFKIGTNAAITGNMNGRVAYVAIYDDTLTTDEIEALSGLGVVGDAYAPNLIAVDRLLHYWPIDGTASPEPDMVGSADLTISGTFNAATSPAINLTLPDPVGVALAQGWWG
jgi:hypothetical protein